MARSEEWWISDELRDVLAQLTAQQASGVQRIVEAELAGNSLSSLLDCEGQICTSTTYYGSGKNKGWRGKPLFNEALRLARRDIRSWMLQQGTYDAMAILSRAAVPAAQDLERQVTGYVEAVEFLSARLDDAVQQQDPDRVKALAVTLGETGSSGALPALRRAVAAPWDPETFTALVKAIGKVAAPINADRQKADVAILDRAGTDTASKAQVHETSDATQRIQFDLSNLSDELLELLADAGDDPGAGESGAGGTE